jgi:hypothetical protein
MGKSDENKLDETQLEWVVQILKHAHVHIAFLDDKAEEFVRNTIARYRKFGAELRLSVKQLSFLEAIAGKLFFVPGAVYVNDAGELKRLGR